MPDSSQTQTRFVEPPIVAPAANTAPPVEPKPAASNSQSQIISGGVEFGPVATAPVEISQPEPLAEITLSKPAEIQIPQELKNTMERSPVNSKPVIAPEVKKAGVVAAVQDEPKIPTPWGTLKLPMTYLNAKKVFQDSRNDDSMRWLASIIMYQWYKYDPDSLKVSRNK